jgi:hypothetical protein
MRNIVFDKDGSLSGTGAPTWISPYYAHFDKAIADGLCTKVLNSDGLYTDSNKDGPDYDLDTVLCSTPLRGFKLGNPEDIDLFIAMEMKIFNLNDETKDWDNNVKEDFGSSIEVIIKNKPHKDGKHMFASILPVEYVYNLHWSNGIDWSHFMLYPSYISEAIDKTTVLRFNYTE